MAAMNDAQVGDGDRVFLFWRYQGSNESNSTPRRKANEAESRTKDERDGNLPMVTGGGEENSGQKLRATGSSFSWRVERNN